ncbi:uncharacterized protein LOC123551683 [Mercenaria mercenaria]|uniref:uncharacterized protein LOC123551683 n=1 Tax=Mercenaria mercenaria TaxID=6596 RepID=UPI00234E7144|nr:uncharacterized protein LOC123551683 [Mercenaria mercenaria]
MRILRDIESEITKKEEDKCRKSFDLLYCASKHRCDPLKFHNLCDSKGPTVTILIGTQNMLFGGYTSQSWTSEKGSFKSDKDAFLFYKEDNERNKIKIFEIRPDCHEWAIYCHRNNGPTFGGGRFANHDLLTFKATWYGEIKLENNVFQLNGKTNIGSVYEDKAGDVDPKAINGGLMTVSDVYVYQVQDEPDKMTDQLKVDIEQHDIRLKAKKEDLLKLNELLHHDYNTDHINILLLGEVRSGKSSFFNTLATVLREEVTSTALTGPEKTSVTTRLHRYELKTKSGHAMPIQVIDIRGFTANSGYEHEIDQILNGNVKPGYEFGKKSKPIGKEFTLAGGPYKIHVVCFVVDVTQVESQQHSAMVKKIREMKETIRKRDLPIIGIATKFDVLCPKIHENVENVQRSAKALDAVKSTAEYLEIQENCVFPVVNYTDDTDIDKAKDILLLDALDCIEKRAMDYLQQVLEWKTLPSVWTSRIDTLETVSKNKEELLSKMGNVEEAVRILCVGRPNTGKSSFIDSVMSALLGEISCRATGGSTQSAKGQRNGIPDTKKYYPYQLKIPENMIERTHVYLCDMPGMHEKNGVQIDQIMSVINGHVPSRHSILSGITDENSLYVQKPQTKDRIHCVCFFFDASDHKGNDVPEWEMNCIQELKSLLHQNDIPFIAVVTKIDLLSTELRAGCQNPYSNQRLTECMVNIGERFGVRRKHVYPVRNYVHEDAVEPATDALLLAVFKEVLKLATETKTQLDKDGTVLE